ncbi:MAG: hypothetical protein ACPGNT_08110 [Rhodospirillales bacterium]
MATNSWLHAKGKRRHFSENVNQGYLCTLNAPVPKARRAPRFQEGACRIFRLSGDRLEQWTEDHPVVLSSTEFYLGCASSMVPEVDVDYRVDELSVDDIFILASDGLFDFVQGMDVSVTIHSSMEDKVRRRGDRECQAAPGTGVRGHEEEDELCGVDAR